MKTLFISVLFLFSSVLFAQNKAEKQMPTFSPNADQKRSLKKKTRINYNKLDLKKAVRYEPDTKQGLSYEQVQARKEQGYTNFTQNMNIITSPSLRMLY